MGGGESGWTIERSVAYNESTYALINRDKNWEVEGACNMNFNSLSVPRGSPLTNKIAWH